MDYLWSDDALRIRLPVLGLSLGRAISLFLAPRGYTVVYAAKTQRFSLPPRPWCYTGLPREHRPAGASAASLAVGTTGAVTLVSVRAVAAGAVAVAAAVATAVAVVKDARGARPPAVTAAGPRLPGTGAGIVRRMMGTRMAEGVATMMMTGTIGKRGTRMRMTGGSRTVMGGRGSHDSVHASVTRALTSRLRTNHVTGFCGLGFVRMVPASIARGESRVVGLHSMGYFVCEAGAGGGWLGLLS